MIPAMIASMLAKKGVSVLGNILENGSDAAIDKVNKLVKEKTGIDLNSKTDLTEEDITALKRVESEERTRLEELRYADTANARNMQVEALRQDDKFVKRFVYYFAVFWSLFAVLFLTGITFLEVPEANTRFADTIVGFILGTVVSTIIGYFYGSHNQS